MQNLKKKKNKKKSIKQKGGMRGRPVSIIAPESEDESKTLRGHQMQSACEACCLYEKRALAL